MMHLSDIWSVLKPNGFWTLSESQQSSKTVLWPCLGLRTLQTLVCMPYVSLIIRPHLCYACDAPTNDESLHIINQSISRSIKNVCFEVAYLARPLNRLWWLLPHQTHVPWSVCSPLSFAITAAPIEMPFARQTRVGPVNHVSDSVLISPGKLYKFLCFRPMEKCWAAVRSTAVCSKGIISAAANCSGLVWPVSR